MHVCSPFFCISGSPSNFWIRVWGIADYSVKNIHVYVHLVKNIHVRSPFYCSSGAPSNFWIRVRGIADCSVKKAHQVAILHYEGAPQSLPAGSTAWDDSNRQGIVSKTMQPDPLVIPL
jgi:hypothetical protein